MDFQKLNILGNFIHTKIKKTGKVNPCGWKLGCLWGQGEMTGEGVKACF